MPDDKIDAPIASEPSDSFHVSSIALGDVALRSWNGVTMVDSPARQRHGAGSCGVRARSRPACALSSSKRVPGARAAC